MTPHPPNVRVVEEPIAVPRGGPTDGLRYRTTGKRVLVRSGGRLFLVHDGWTPRGVVRW